MRRLLSEASVWSEAVELGARWARACSPSLFDVVREGPSCLLISPPLDLAGVYFWRPYPVFEAVRYGEIKRDTAGYS